MEKNEKLGLILYALALILGVSYLVIKKMKWPYYLVLVFLIAPAFYILGYAIGKKEDKEIAKMISEEV